MDSMRRLPFPPGFRFHPTDQELVSYYLKNKVRGHQMSDVIAEIDLYRFEPWDLPAMSQIQTKDLEWYFFTPRDTKHSNSSRMSRATAAGYWKATGKARSVGSASRTVGVKKTLVYYKGRAPRGERTNWVMHEYSLEDSECERLKVLQNGFVLCRVFKKSGPGPRNGDQYGAPFEEEDDWSVVPVNEQQYSASPEIEQREAVSGNLELEAGDTPFCGDTTLMNCHVPDQQKISILEDTQKILDSDKDKNLQKEEWSRVASTGNKEIDTVGNQTKHFNGTTVMEPPGDTFSSPCPTYLEPVTNHGVVAHESQSIKSDGKEHDEREILEELLGLIVGENIMNEANETKTMEINALYSHSDGNALFGNLPMDGSSLNDTELLDGDFLELDDLLLPCSEKEVEEQLSAGETGIQIRVKSSLPFSYSDMNAVSSFKSRLQKNLIHFPQEGSDRMMPFHVANTQEQPLVPDTPVQSNPPEKDFKYMENPLARSKATAGFEELDYDFVLDFFEQLHAVNSASVDGVEDVSHLTKSKIIGQTQSEVTPCLDTGESKNLEDELDSLWVSAADVALDESIQCLQAPNKISGSEMFSDFATPEFGCNASQLQSSLGPLIESDGMIPLACLGVEEVLFPGNALQSDVQEQRPAGLMNSEQTNLLYGEPMQDPNLTSSNGWAGIMSKGLSSLLNVLDSVPAFPASAAELSPKAVSSVSVMTTSINTTLTLACSSHDTDSSCPNCSSTVDKQGRFVKSQFHKEKVSKASKKGFLTIALLGAFWAFFWLLLAGSAWKFMNFIYKIITSCRSWKLGASML